VWANRSLLEADSSNEDAFLDEEDAEDFYLDEVKNLKSIKNGSVTNP